MPTVGDHPSDGPGRWHLHAVRLPDGLHAEDWWIVDGRWSDTPVPGARPLPGAWFVPGGLADVHVHVTMNFNGFALVDGSAALIAANLAAQRQAGVLMLRDTGLAWGGRLGAAQPAGEPLVQRAGRIHAPPGRGYPQICADTPAIQLIAAARAEIAAGATWVKILADFPGPDGNWLAAPANYTPEDVRALVEAVHAAGARVAAHTTGPAAGALVRAGVDSIEHGSLLDAEALEEMGRRGVAWVPTLATAIKHLGGLARLAGPPGELVRAWFARTRELLPLAVSLGVPVLAGTDELPHGTIAAEVAALHAHGLSAQQALAAASTAAHTYLGAPPMAAGAPAYLASFAGDPRLQLDLLARPAAVVAAGIRII